MCLKYTMFLAKEVVYGCMWLIIDPCFSEGLDSTSKRELLTQEPLRSKHLGFL
jgi:hypothetical protein